MAEITLAVSLVFIMLATLLNASDDTFHAGTHFALVAIWMLAVTIYLEVVL